MAAPNPSEPEFEPFVPASQSPPEFTIAPLVIGSLLGVLFGASSVWLVLKVGLTVSAAIPVAVLSFALFRVMQTIGSSVRGSIGPEVAQILAAIGFRKNSVLESNIAQ